MPTSKKRVSISWRSLSARRRYHSRMRWLASVRPRALDLVTAATALFYDLTLVTRNQRDYADIPRLRLYNIEQ